MTTADVLGKPFQEIIEDQEIKVKTSKATSLVILDDTSTGFVFKGSNKKRTGCRMTVSVVGPEGSEHDRDTVTHFMISLTDEKAEFTLSSRDICNEAIDAPRDTLLSSTRLHCGVMG